jgi:hypothetical protein
MKTPILGALSLGACLLGSAGVSAEEKCKMSWESPAADSSYPQQLAIDVGDVPGHQVRVYEAHRVFSNAKPNCEGLKMVERWSRGYSDYVDRNGRTWGYEVTTLENGDKIFDEYNGTAQTVVGADGSKKSTVEAVSRWTGGTGKYQGVRGIEWLHVVFDPDKGFSQQKNEAEYWLAK